MRTTNRRSKRKVVAAFAAVAIAAMIGPAAQAYQHWPNNARLTYGVSGQQYWVGEGADTYNAGINNAVASWDAASGKISYSRTSVRANARIDWTYPNVATNACANARFYVNTTEINGGPNGEPNQNYWYGKIQIRPAINDAGACGPASHRQGIFGHEMGHVLGLAHVEGGGPRIMQRTIAFPEYHGVNTPQPDDVNGVNALY